MPLPPSELGLTHNPFEPSASGAPVGTDLWLPPSWASKLKAALDRAMAGTGAKVLIVTGPYGSGKSYILEWLRQRELPERRILPFYFDNPGVQFYDLANALLRQIGRKEFAKQLWELASVHVRGYQHNLFCEGFEGYLSSFRSAKPSSQPAADLQQAILQVGVTQDEEIAHRLARIVVEFPRQPYFEYRDFVAGKRDALVAEGEEAPYFQALLQALQLGQDVKAIGFLIDEFEEIALQKRLTRRDAYDYLATLKRLINLARDQSLLVVLAMTPDGLEKTRALEPALADRFSDEGECLVEVPPLSMAEATELVRSRLGGAAVQGEERPSPLWPFPSDFPTGLRAATYANPRQLVKFCFYALSRTDVTPITSDLLQATDEWFYPSGGGGEAV